jgi:hypothetical protein
MTGRLLGEGQLDCLMVDSREDAWVEWLTNTTQTQVPTTIVWMTLAEYIGQMNHGPVQSEHRKRLGRLGYDMQFWHMKAELHGAALHQDCLATIYTLRHRSDGCGPKPPRRMGNRLPTTQASDKYAATYHPCVVRECIGESPVFSASGPMPDKINAWIETDKGVRRLQAEELAKAKGLPKEWLSPLGTSNKGAFSWAQGATCSHLWSAVLDTIAEWIDERRPELKSSGVPLPTTRARPRKQRRARAKNQKDLTPVKAQQLDWEWELPELSPGGAWYRERVASLNAATAGHEEADRLRAEGFEILARHRENYTQAGPRILQLIWWEFPPESWEAIREGSSMNFMVTPEREIKANSEFNEVELAVAIKFFDELIALKVLIPATEPLKANCPLFCVEKPHKAGAYRCIADAKLGGQNQCMAKDPVYLSRADDILPRLYSGGFSAVADASKHFHNFKTRPDERHVLGCIHPGEGSEWIYAGLPMGTTNSPAIACRQGNSGLRRMREQESIFQGHPHKNTWRGNLSGQGYDEGLGHGRIVLSEDGEPVALVFSMVDDFLVHAHTQERAMEAFSVFMDHSVRLGFICQPIKTSPPSQI